MKSNVKNVICALLFIISAFACFSSDENKVKSAIVVETKESLNDNYHFIDLYIKVYGVLKYFHPDYSTGIISIDNVFIKNLIPQDSLYSLVTFNKTIDKIIHSSANYTALELKSKSDSVNENLFSWIDESVLLDSSNKKCLKILTHNINQREKLFYVYNRDGNTGEVQIKNEEIKSDPYYPLYKYRILALAKFWNIINYFYPYKSQIDSFEDLNLKYLPILSACKTATDYHLAILRLTAELNDGHVNTLSYILEKYFGDYNLPFILEYYFPYFYISRVYPDINRIKSGDILLAINQKPVDSIAKEYLNYISSKNKYVIQNKLCSLLVISKYDTVNLKILRKQDTLVVKTPTITYSQNYGFSYQQSFYSENNVKMMPFYMRGKTTYINLLLANTEQIKVAFDNSDTVIFDLRNYIKTGLMYDIANMLLPEKEKFFWVTMPDLNNPGNFRFADDLFCGATNDKPYKDVLIVLINENTISQAETACMIFSLYKKTIFIGRNTCGANGDKVPFSLPGKIHSNFSGVGILDLNKKELQNIGIKPDIYIERVPRNFEQGTDELLEYLKFNIK